MAREAEYSTDEKEFTVEEEVDKLHEARERQTEEIIVAGSDIISAEEKRMLFARAGAEASES